jgi:hypothetical protein
MLPDHPSDITEQLQQACATLSDQHIPKGQRINASMHIRRLLKGMDLQVDTEHHSTSVLRAMLTQADVSLGAMEHARDILALEAAEYHQTGTSVDDLIHTCRRHIYSMRQRAEIFG